MDPNPLNFSPQPWMVRANCRGMTTNDFFPERGENRANAAARQVCDGCAVRDECIQFALDNNETAGIWGGLSGKQRRALRRQRQGSQAFAPEHGTRAGYQWHVRWGVEPCDACREADRDYESQRRVNRRSAVRVAS
jgi:WhiB family transcriptional regulator, redox-sensing transcriptional regulator